MRRLILLGVVCLTMLGSTGCILNQYDSDPNIRMQQLLNHSENLRQVRGEWHRFWMNDQPSHLSPVRTNGLISP